ncbi:precorrin-3B C(17)-methyltransferase [Thermosulfuriphilus sp.]
MSAKIYVVGLGSGSPEEMTLAARAALERAEVIVGYHTYLDLIAPLISGKFVFGSGMRQEIKRCLKALEFASSGKTVAVVSSGDPGIYGMAGLILELVRSQGVEMEVEVVAGIPALSFCAARLGAPLMHDFAVISLSDLLTPWELILKRLAAAAAADFVIVIYNPRSSKRQRHLLAARELILEHRLPETPVGVVRAAGRQGEFVEIVTLGELDPSGVDMQTTLIVGNSQTYIWEGRMITPRGYRL